MNFQSLFPGSQLLVGFCFSGGVERGPYLDLIFFFFFLGDPIVLCQSELLEKNVRQEAAYKRSVLPKAF